MEDAGSLFGSLIVLIAVGALLLTANAFAPLNGRGKTIVSVLVVAVMVLRLPTRFVGDFGLSEGIQFAR